MPKRSIHLLKRAARINILILTTHLNIGGITSHIADLGVGLVRRGHRVVVASSGGEMAADLVRDGVESRVLDIRTKSELAPRLWRSIPGLIRLVREKGIQVLHAHTRVAQVAAECVYRACGVPNVTTCHGLYKRRLGRRLFPCWGVRSVAISEVVRQHLIRDFHVAPERVVLVSNGLNVSRFSNSIVGREERDAIRARYGLARNSVVFGIVSRIAQVKGHEFFIRAFRWLKAEYPDRQLQCLIVGDGNYKKRILRLVVELKLTEDIRFVPAVRNPVEPLSAIDVFVFPVTWQEGFGLSVLEAMAMEIPVIASRIGAIDSIVEEGVTGYLTPVRDVGQIARYMEQLSRDRALARKMGCMGRRIVEERFSVEAMTGSMEAVYGEVSKS